MYLNINCFRATTSEESSDPLTYFMRCLTQHKIRYWLGFWSQKYEILLKILFMFIGCHNPVMQQSSEIDILSKEKPHVTLVIT